MGNERELHIISLYYSKQDGYALPILNIFVPQVGHVPWVAGRPFFMVIDWVPCISLFVRHFTQ